MPPIVEHNPNPTQGPWEVAIWSLHEFSIVSTVNGKKVHISGPALPADAYLMAAAKHMLHDLNTVLALLEPMEKEGKLQLPGLIDNIKKTIAKTKVP